MISFILTSGPLSMLVCPDKLIRSSVKPVSNKGLIFTQWNIKWCLPRQTSCPAKISPEQANDLVAKYNCFQACESKELTTVDLLKISTHIPPLCIKYQNIFQQIQTFASQCWICRNENTKLAMCSQLYILFFGTCLFSTAWSSRKKLTELIKFLP